MATTNGTKKGGAPIAPAEGAELLRYVYDHVAETIGNSVRAEPFPGGLNFVKFKFELTGVGSVEIELSSQRKEKRDPCWARDGDEVTVTALPCVPENAKAKDILGTCDSVFESNKDDCNKFTKASSTPYFGEIFSGMNADAIIDSLRQNGSGWTETKSISECVEAAQQGKFVIAGMKSTELNESHGHLAVVVACPTQDSGNPAVKVPIGYAGSISNPAARIRGARLTGTFKASLVREEKVAYFYKEPTQ